MSIKVLHINSHPLFTNEKHATVQLAQHGIQALADKEGIENQVINLYDGDFFLPKVDNILLSAWFKKESEWTAEEKNVLNRQNDLINQWIEADYVFIYSPLHNFNVTAAFKDYVDNILIAGRTFKYTEQGSVGLLSDDKKVVYVQSSGGAYQEELKYIHADIAPHYVRTILSVMGINKMQLIRVEGLDIRGNDRQALVAKGKQELSAYINTHLSV